MNRLELQRLRRLARLEGIQTSFTNNAGQRQSASPETLLALLKSLGLPLASPADVGDAWEHARARRRRRALPPVMVAWQGKPAAVWATLPNVSWRGPVACRLVLEDGESKQWRLSTRLAGQAKAVDAAHLVVRLPLPALPPGYHRFELQTPSAVFQSVIISAPPLSYSDPAADKDWGVFLPLYALHSSRSWGAGNYDDWSKLSAWIGTQGGKLVATLPLLAGFFDWPTCEPSPYSPASRLFWNEFYIDIEQVPELATSEKAQRLVRSAAFQKTLTRFRQAAEIDYREQWAARRQVFEVLAREFQEQRSDRRQAFHRFLQQRPEVEDYAQFRAACERQRSSWHTWPERMKRGQLRPSDYRPEVKHFYCYIQWLAHQQIERLMSKGTRPGAQLHLDLPLGVHPDGYDVWRHRQTFALEASVGAPSDAFFTKGQDWGFAPLHPAQLREQGYRYVREYLQFTLQHTALLRIDHVMGLHRLYWIPKGFAPTQGAYVRYPAEELYAMLCLESQRHKTTLVGENLGTVPKSVNDSMQRHHLRQMYVLQFEQRPDPRHALRSPPRRCVASINTHDMPTFAAFWKGLDLTDRQQLGLISSQAELTQLRRARRKVQGAVVAFLRRHGYFDAGTDQKAGASNLPDPTLVLKAFLKWLSASAAETVLVNLEDLWMEERPQNVPGTCQERPNWRRPARLSLEQMQEDARVQQILQAVAAWRGQASRPAS